MRYHKIGIIFLSGYLFSADACGTFKGPLKSTGSISEKDFLTALSVTDKCPDCLNRLLLNVAETPAMSSYEKYAAIATLLFSKADAGTRAKGDDTALYLLIQCAGAHRRNDNESAQLLIDQMVPLRRADSAQYLERAICFYNIPLLRSLMAAKADVNAVSRFSKITALHRIANVTVSDEQACVIFNEFAQAATPPPCMYEEYEGDEGSDKTPLQLASLWGKKSLSAMLVMAGAPRWQMDKKMALKIEQTYREELAQLPVKGVITMVLEYLGLVCTNPKKKKR